MKFNKLIPELDVKDINKSLNFYVNVLNFKKEYERKGFAFVSYQGSQLMLDELKSDSDWQTGKLEYPYGRGINFQIEVTNIDHIYNLLKKNKFSIKKNKFSIKRKFMENWYECNGELLGNKEFLVMDPDGYLIRFCEELGVKIC